MPGTVGPTVEIGRKWMLWVANCWEANQPATYAPAA